MAVLKNNLPLFAETVDVFCRYNIIQPLMRRPLLPRTLHIIPTHRCNARCIMCGLWKDINTGKELTLDHFEKLFDDRLFSKMEYIGINGGEPFLRNDLVNIVDIIQRKCPSLKRISITSNGILTNKIKSSLEKMIDLSEKRNILLDISISLHALGELLSSIYGVEHAFEKISDTLEILKYHRNNKSLTFSLNCVLLAKNLPVAPILLSWAKENNIPISFVIGEQRDRFDNHEMTEVFVKNDQKNMLIDFFRNLERDDAAMNTMTRLKYRELLGMIEGKSQRTLSCYYAFSGLMLGYDGSLYYCSHSRAIGNCLARSAYDIFYDIKNLRYRQTELFQKECRHCPPYTRTRLELEKDILKFLRFMAVEKCHKLLRKKDCMPL